MEPNYTAIVSMIMRGERLQTVLDAMAEYLRAAIIFVNDEMDIIAFSKVLPARDPYWAAALQEGHCSTVMLSQIYRSPFVQKLPRISSITSGNSYPPDNVTLKYFIVLPRNAFCRNIAVLALPLEDRFEKLQQDLLLSFASLVRSTYLHAENQSSANSSRDRKSILQSLLESGGEYPFGGEEAGCDSDDRAFSGQIQALVLSPKFREISDTLLFSLADAVCSHLGNDHAAVYNGSVVSIFRSEKRDELDAGYCKEQLTGLAEQSNAKIGISRRFSGKEAFRRHYKQATFAIEMAKKLDLPGRIFTYDDMYIYSLTDRCQKQAHWAGIEHPVLTALRAYDAAHHSCLYDTLYCLLKCGMNSPLAAKKLGIHKSSLYHRVEVLKDLIPGLLVKNSEWQTSVMLAFDLARLNNTHQ